MQLIPYKKALSMGKEKLAKALVPVRVLRAKKQAELEMLKIEEEIATLEAGIVEVCTAEQPNFAKIIDKQDELGLLERRKGQYQKILDEMFPED